MPLINWINEIRSKWMFPHSPWALEESKQSPFLGTALSWTARSSGGPDTGNHVKVAAQLLI